MSREVFNPEATDGDGDGMVQDGTQFERPADELPETLNLDATEPEVTEEPVVEEKIEEAPVLEETPVEPKPAKQKSTSAKVDSGKVAIHSSKNAYWQGVGRLQRGYHIVSRKEADQWLTLSYVREATEDEMKAL
jgi:hypothetical protein